MRKLLINIGGVIAILLMISPVIVINFYSSFETYEFIFLLIVTLCYDFYLYSIIDKDNRMKNEKNHYYNVMKGIHKKLKLTDKEKIKHLEEYIEKLINNYFE